MRYLLVFMLLLASPAFAEDPVSPDATAIKGKPRVWKALSGHEIEIDGKRARLAGITCPDPDTPEGRDAKALVNVMLKSGKTKCRLKMAGGVRQATCTSNGYVMNDVLVEQGYCKKGMF